MSVYVSDYPRSWVSRDIYDLFDREAGVVDRVDMKEKYSFVIFKDQSSADDAVNRLNDHDTGRSRLRVEISKGDNRKKKDQPITSNIVFVVNFDKENTTERDIERFFEDFHVQSVEMWRGGKGIRNKNYCFVTLRDENCAKGAIEVLDGKYLGDRQVTVEPRSGHAPRRRSSRDRTERRDSRDREYRRQNRGSDYAPYPSTSSRRRDSRGRDRRDERDMGRRRDERDMDRRRDERDTDRRRDERGMDRRRDERDTDRRRDDRDRRDDRRERDYRRDSREDRSYDRREKRDDRDRY